jgi:transposase-like protein
VTQRRANYTSAVTAASYARWRASISERLKRKHPGFGDTFFIDEVFVTIAGQRHYLWRAVDQDGDVTDVYLQTRRDAEVAKRFFRRLLRSHGKRPTRARENAGAKPLPREDGERLLLSRRR